MLDQYESPVPDDLVALDMNPADLMEEDLKAVDGLDWYQPDRDEHPDGSHLILVSQAKLSEIGTEGSDLADCGMDEPLRAVEKIDAVLHRWSEQDGFYHA